MIIALVLICLPQFIFKLSWINRATTDGIEILLYSSQIISSIFVIAGTIIAVWQYYLSSTKRINELKFSRVEKAIELSEYYKENILGNYSFVKSVFDSCGITEMLHVKRSTCELKDFDINELKSIYSKKEIEKFETLDQDKKFIDAIIKMSVAHNFGVKGYTKELSVEDEKKQGALKISVNPQEVFNDFYKTYIVQTLNNAEYFAMAFIHKAADESVIYQSIHPTFLEMCFVMYYYISVYSDPSVTKLYTNVADLYCVWRERQKEQSQKLEADIKKNAKTVGTVIDD